MPARWKTGLVLLAILTLSAAARAEPLTAQAVITRCASQADAKLEGISALTRVCPGVEAALGQLGLTSFLPADWRNNLTAGGLGDLGALTQRYSGTMASGMPGAAVLRSLAASLVPPPPPPTWSQRIGAWIQRQIGPLLERVGQWLRSLGPQTGRSALARTLLYGLIALLLVVVAVLLLLELRGTGVLRRGQSTRRLPRRPAVGGHPVELAEGEWRDPDWAGLRVQPARLLRLLVDTLTRAHRLERDRHLTCRELEREARFESEFEREGFGRVALLAERELYGPPGATVLAEEILRDAKELHARLLAGMFKDGEIRP